MAVKIDIDYAGSLHCNLTHGPSGSSIETDAPKDNAGKGEAFSPTDLVAAALASCAITTMAIKAPKEDIPFEGAKAVTHKHMTAEPPRKIRELQLTIEVSGDYSDAQKARLTEIANTCPVALSLHSDVVQALSLVFAD